MTYKIASVTSDPVSEPALPGHDRVRFVRPLLPALEDVLSAFRVAYQQGVLTNGGLARKFEDATAERLNVRHCVAISSGTSALMTLLVSRE